MRTPTVFGVLFPKINKCLSRARRSLLCPTVGLPRHKRKRVSFPPLNWSTVRAGDSLEGKAALAKREKAALHWGIGFSRQSALGIFGHETIQLMVLVQVRPTKFYKDARRATKGHKCCGTFRCGCRIFEQWSGGRGTQCGWSGDRRPVDQTEEKTENQTHPRPGEKPQALQARQDPN